ncbi:MAG: short-chain dehydrogenase, partial [Clostridia bacterium]
DTKTGFTASRKKECAGDDVYKGLISKSVSRMEHDEQNGTAPESVADTVIFVANKKRVKPFYTVGLKYKFFVYHAKFLPHSLINRLLRILYAK